MKTLIAIPTKGRIDTIGKNTLSWLPAVKCDWRLFLEPQEMSLYQRFFPQFTDHFVSIGENNRGLMFSLSKIKEYAISEDYDLIFKVDDDVKGWHGANRKKSLTPALTFEEGLRACESKMTDEKVGGISFPYSSQMYEIGEAWAKRGRLQSCYVIRPRLMYDNLNVRVFTDFSSFIALRAKGFECVRYNWLGMDIQPVGKYAGGLQTLDRASFYAGTIETLSREFPFLRFRKVEGKEWTEEPDMRSVP